MSRRVVIGGVALTATLGAFVAMAGGSVAATAADTHHAHYFERSTSFTHTKKYLEFTDKDYVGNHNNHAARYTATDHFKCFFGKGAPTCDGQITRGRAMLLVHGKGGQGTFTIPITGGTGTLAGAHGTLKVRDIGDTGNADLTVSYTL